MESQEATMTDRALNDIAERTMKRALSSGADQAAVSAAHASFVHVKQRVGRIEQLQSSSTRGLTLSIYAGGRYSSNSTSYLESGPLDQFVDEALAMTRQLAPDRYRGLADPELYGPTEGVDIDVVDSGYDDLDMPRRKELVAAAEQAATDGGDAVISATADVTTQSSDFLQIHSNGFRGTQRSTSFFVSVSVTARDEGERRPEDHHYAGARHLNDLPEAEAVGREAARRALGRLGSSKAPSKKMTLVVENRAAGRLVGSLLGPTTGAALQQRRSCLEGKLGEQLGSAALHLTDEPLIVRGLGSRTFDGDGLAARPRSLFVDGRLESYLIDVYYGRKLEMPPTSGSTSNLVMRPGLQSFDQLLRGVKDGVLVTSFLGGNSNPATGDFSMGVSGFTIENGALARPVSEMNIADNHTEFWHRLELVGDDPFPYGGSRIPTLVFSDVQFSGGPSA